GNGWHLYWPLRSPVTIDLWKRYANSLKAACAQHGLKADDAVTTDVVKCLRVPFTINWKYPQRPKQVLLVPYSFQLDAYPLEAFDCLLGKEAVGKARTAHKTTDAGIRTCTKEALQYYGLAVSAIKNSDEYKTWRDVGFALHSTGWGDEAYEIWTEWSKRSDKFDEANQRSTWSKFK